MMYVIDIMTDPARCTLLDSFAYASQMAKIVYRSNFLAFPAYFCRVSPNDSLNGQTTLAGADFAFDPVDGLAYASQVFVFVKSVQNRSYPTECSLIVRFDWLHVGKSNRGVPTSVPSLHHSQSTTT